MKPLVFAAALWLCSVGCARHETDAPAGNTVVAYLRGADLQAETDDQRREVLHALNDMLEKSPAELRNARYADYGGKPGVRTPIQILTDHFVPPQPAALDPDRFYTDVSAPEARSVIEAQRDKLQNAIK